MILRSTAPAVRPVRLVRLVRLAIAVPQARALLYRFLGGHLFAALSSTDLYG